MPERPGTPSIGLAYSPMLEVLPKPTLPLFVKKSFPFWREKFSRMKNCECLLSTQGRSPDTNFNLQLLLGYPLYRYESKYYIG